MSPDIYTYERECDEIDEHMKKMEKKMKKQIIKDTAEYNYNLGYLKALDEVEKMIQDCFYEYPYEKFSVDRIVWFIMGLKIKRGEKE